MAPVSADQVTLHRTSEATASSAPQCPLVVDLDGTLLRTDLLIESLLLLLKKRPLCLFLLPFWLACQRRCKNPHSAG